MDDGIGVVVPKFMFLKIVFKSVNSDFKVRLKKDLSKPRSGYIDTFAGFHLAITDPNNSLFQCHCRYYELLQEATVI